MSEIEQYEVKGVCAVGDKVKIINGHKSTPYTPEDNGKVVTIIEDCK